MTHIAPGQALSPHRKLELVAARLNELHEGWTLEGDQVRGPGTTAVRLGPPHPDDPRRIDLDFLLNVDHPDRMTLSDSGTGPPIDVEDALIRAIDIWAETTVGALAELSTRENRFGNYYGEGHPAAFPGWHAVTGTIAGWGVEPGLGTAMRWIADTRPWVALAPTIAPALFPKRINGVMISFTSCPHEITAAEVRVNGRLHRRASLALRELGIPRCEELALARTYLLLMQDSFLTSG